LSPGRGGAGVAGGVGPATDPRVVADQAAGVAAAWSPAGAPSSWRLTACQFELLRDDRELRAIAATIPPEKLPPLLFSAAATFLVLELEPRPLREFFPRIDEPQPLLDRHFAERYRGFCLDHRARLLELCAHHRYQMNEVARCAQLLPALARAIADGRETVLVDIGTGAGLALQLDRYRYLYRSPPNQLVAVGDPDAGVVLETELRGRLAAPLPATLPRIFDRVGIDIEPLDVANPPVRKWLAACTPQEIGAVTRFHRALEVAIAHPAPRVRGDACASLPGVLAQAPPDALVCLIDTYVHVFFPGDELRRFRSLVKECGTRRDLDWVSIDPLVPMGESARDSVTGVAVPAVVARRSKREGVFGVISRLGYRGGHRSDALVGLAHPGGAWLEWMSR